MSLDKNIKIKICKSTNKFAKMYNRRKGDTATWLSYHVITSIGLLGRGVGVWSVAQAL